MNKISRQMLFEADLVYTENAISWYFDMRTGKERRKSLASDTLALFIGREIISVTDGCKTDAEAREQIAKALSVAITDIEKVISHFRGNR